MEWSGVAKGGGKGLGFEVVWSGIPKGEHEAAHRNRVWSLRMSFITGIGMAIWKKGDFFPGGQSEAIWVLLFLLLLFLGDRRKGGEGGRGRGKGGGYQEAEKNTGGEMGWGNGVRKRRRRGQDIWKKLGG